MSTLLLIAIAALLAVVLMNAVQRAAKAPAPVRVENPHLRARRRTRR